MSAHGSFEAPSSEPEMYVVRILEVYKNDLGEWERTIGCVPSKNYRCMCRSSPNCGCRLTNPPTHFHSDGGRYLGGEHLPDERYAEE